MQRLLPVLLATLTTTTIACPMSLLHTNLLSTLAGDPLLKFVRQNLHDMAAYKRLALVARSRPPPEPISKSRGRALESVHVYAQDANELTNILAELRTGVTPGQVRARQLEQTANSGSAILSSIEAERAKVPPASPSPPVRFRMFEPSAFEHLP